MTTTTQSLWYNSEILVLVDSRKIITLRHNLMHLKVKHGNSSQIFSAFLSSYWHDQWTEHEEFVDSYKINDSQILTLAERFTE
jgi:hypothetical protein